MSYYKDFISIISYEDILLDICKHLFYILCTLEDIFHALHGASVECLLLLLDNIIYMVNVR